MDFYAVSSTILSIEYMDIEWFLVENGRGKGIFIRELWKATNQMDENEKQKIGSLGRKQRRVRGTKR